MSSQNIYSLRKNEVFPALETSPEGLSFKEALARQSLYGKNILAEPEKSPIWRRWVAAATHPTALLLWVAGAVLLLIKQPLLSTVIWLVVIVNATFSFYREYWAERAVTSLKNFLPATARVVRDGQDQVIAVGDIVPGDLIVLAEGDQIPADARIVDEYGLRINHATLTGEALPVRKTADASFRDDLSDLERPNLAFMGTTVVSGTGRAVVYATGMLTQFGRIAHLTQSVPEQPSRLQQEMDHLSRILSIAAVVIGLVVLLSAINDVGLPFRESIILAIGIVVAIIPEGLSPAVTLSLAMGVQRLAQKGVLVKRLSTLETMGSVSVLCTDKSGTLTQNQMTVCNAWIGGQRYRVTGTGYEPKGLIQKETSASKDGRVDLETFLIAAFLCNNARLQPPGPGKARWSALGDQTEAALLAMAMKGDIQNAVKNYPRVHELPFDARRKRMSTIHRFPDGQEVAFVKGSPREILQLCTTIRWQGRLISLTSELRSQIMAENDRYACQALRVLALAQRDLQPRSGSYSVEGVEQDLTFLGLAAMMDPPRPEVAQSIAAFREAGIRMVMITGDYGLTAESLARRIGMMTGPAPQIITGADLDAMTDETLQTRIQQNVLFSRMAPEHKMRLVAAYQSLGEVVAVVGDGVNDAPALRKADIGFAMGVTGVDVAREAADVILTRDDFGQIVQGIREGRAVYDNLRKFITYLFASNVPEVLPFLLTALLNLPQALTVLQILIIDLGTDLLPALALGAEPPEPNILHRPPRKMDRPLVDKPLLFRSFAWLGILEALLCYTGFSLFLSSGGPGRLLQPDSIFGAAYSENRLRLASTIFFTGVIIAQAGNAFACRSEKGNVRWLGLFSNRPLLIGLAVQMILLFGMVSIRPLAARLGLMALPGSYWIGLALFAPALYGLERARKWAFNRYAMKKGGAP
jgi:magnesium-transporting ATPase (P-type)